MIAPDHRITRHTAGSGYGVGWSCSCGATRHSYANHTDRDHAALLHHPAVLAALAAHARKHSDWAIKGMLDQMPIPPGRSAAAAVYLVDALEMAEATGEGAVIDKLADTQARLIAMTDVAAESGRDLHSVTERWQEQERQICAALQPILYTDERDPACLATAAAQVIRDARARMRHQRSARVAELELEVEQLRLEMTELKGPGEMDPGGWRPSDLLPRPRGGQ